MTKRALGFTLVELVISMAVLAIMVMLAVPAFTSLINSNRLTAQANELVADIQSARMEAIRRNRPVTMCPTLDDATCSDAGDWGRRIIVAQEVPGPGLELIRTSVAKDQLELSADVDSIVFRPDGMARDATGLLQAATFDVCLPTSQPEENMRRVTMASGSRIATQPMEHDTAGECPQ